MKQKWHGLSDGMKGVLAGIASALFLTAYLVVNKHVYNTYDIGALEYSLLFALAGGLFGAASLRRHMNKVMYERLRKDAGKFVVLSLASFVAVGLLVFGQRYTSSINASLIGTATILTTIFFSAIMLREHITSRQRLWLLVLFVGMYIGIVGLHKLHLNKGDAIILSSEIIFGFGNVLSRKVMRKHGSLIVPNIRLVLAAGYALIASLFAVRSFEVIGRLWPWVLVAGMLYWLTMKTFAASVHLINANHAVVLNNGQVVTTALAGVLLLGEGYSWEKLVGSVVVLTSIYFIAWKGRAT
ncbi:DMT family transporter [Candidatus Saccharibacteria bacterium]|nr:MAG: DMT family transporter [Candidatus Saccharibacteria bacterium]